MCVLALTSRSDGNLCVSVRDGQRLRTRVIWDLSVPTLLSSFLSFTAYGNLSSWKDCKHHSNRRLSESNFIDSKSSIGQRSASGLTGGAIGISATRLIKKGWSHPPQTCDFGIQRQIWPRSLGAVIFVRNQCHGEKLVHTIC